VPEESGKDSTLRGATGDEIRRDPMSVPERPAVERFTNGQSIGIGSLPHRDSAAAAAFSISEFEIATIPALPMRSPAEGMIAQAIAGLPGVSLGQYGSFAIDPVGLTDATAIETDLTTDAFGGLRAFLDLARKVGVDGKPVKWQFVGPVTLGVALQRAGLRTTEAFTIAADAVRHHVAQISAAVSEALPNSPQLLLLDEPWLVQLMEPEFPIPPDVAVDLISTGMAAVPADVAVGLHCCGPCDVATMLESGPQVISLPVSEDLIDYAGYLGRFISSGGVIAWGVLPTAGPLPAKPDRYWRQLSEVWCALVERGVDASELRRQSLVSPDCGLAQHQVSTARRVARLTHEVGRKVNAQAISTKLAFGA
jgi:methionine synthase II (cobalamin-independent)